MNNKGLFIDIITIPHNPAGPIILSYLNSFRVITVKYKTITGGLSRIFLRSLNFTAFSFFLFVLNQSRKTDSLFT